MKIIPQPPLDPKLRDTEHHHFWPAFILALLGAGTLLYGAFHQTAVDTTDGGVARENQLVKAFSAGGLTYPKLVEKPPPPPDFANPVASAEALDRWAREQANAKPPKWKVRVDRSSKTPCPT